MKTLVFFNNKGGVGKTSLVYHLAWMHAEVRLNVLAVDLVPQADLSAMFLPEEPNHRSLMPLAQDALKPMFFLKPADCVLGSHLSAARACYWDFR